MIADFALVVFGVRLSRIITGIHINTKLVECQWRPIDGCR